MLPTMEEQQIPGKKGGGREEVIDGKFEITRTKISNRHTVKKFIYK